MELFVVVSIFMASGLWIFRVKSHKALASFLVVILFVPILGCAGDDNKNDLKDVGGDSDTGKAKESDHFELKDSGAGASARITLSQSLSNNPLTSQTINVSKAAEIAEKMQSGKGKGFFEEKLSAERLARRGVAPVVTTARRIASLEMEKGASNSVSDAVKLEVALAAIAARNFYMAEYLLPVLVESKNPRIKAGANNAMGVMALAADRVPEAVLYFREALKAVENYRPAMLNLGLTALKGGDLGLAKRYLGDLQSDWFVQANMITIARLEGNSSKAGDLCSRVLSKEPDHKAVLYNCALFELQNRGSYEKARSYAEKATRAKHGEVAWDDRLFNLSNQIDMQEAEKKRKAAQKAAQEKAKKSPKPAQNQPASPQKAPAAQPQGGK